MKVRIARLVAVFAVLALVLAACGDGAEDTTTTAGSEEPTTTAAPDEPPPRRRRGRGFVRQHRGVRLIDRRADIGAGR